MYESRIDLAGAVREEVFPLLQARLADAVDLFTQISREIDKQLWFVEAHLQADR